MLVSGVNWTDVAQEPHALYEERVAKIRGLQYMAGRILKVSSQTVTSSYKAQ